MKRGRLITMLAAMLLLGACGDQTDKTPVPPGVEDGVFVGKIEGTDALVALIVEGDSVTAYTCGGEASWQALTGWFETGVTGNALEPTVGGWEMELRGQYEVQAWSGTLTVDGRALAWTASRALADRPAGLYVLDTETREAGLIIDNDLNTAGVYYGKSSGQTATVRVRDDLEEDASERETIRIDTSA